MLFASPDNTMFKFNLGDIVKDSITPFKGVVVGRTEWLNGCIRYALQSQKLDTNGTPTDFQQFDEAQLVLVEEKKTKKATKAEDRTGGPRKDSVLGLKVSR